MWGRLDCIVSNSDILGYAVDFRVQNGASDVNRIVAETFTADNLMAGVIYTFQVAAFNQYGVGPFSESINIPTHEICTSLLS